MHLNCLISANSHLCSRDHHTTRPGVFFSPYKVMSACLNSSLHTMAKRLCGIVEVVSKQFWTKLQYAMLSYQFFSELINFNFFILFVFVFLHLVHIIRAIMLISVQNEINAYDNYLKIENFHRKWMNFFRFHIIWLSVYVNYTNVKFVITVPWCNG